MEHKENSSRIKYLLERVMQVNEETSFGVELSIDSSNYVEIRIYPTKEPSEKALYWESYQFPSEDNLTIVDADEILYGILKTGKFELPKEEV